MEKKSPRRKFHKQHRILQRFVKALDVIAVTLPFALCWMFYYLENTQVEPARWAQVLLILLFAVLYYCFAHLYSGFLLHLSRISELVYAQILALTLADVFMYFVICMVCDRMVAVWPILITYVIQVVIVVLWCCVAHQWYFHTFARKRTVIVWDERAGLDELICRYETDKHFDVVAVISVQDCIESEYHYLKDAEVVFYSGVHSFDRNAILKYCIENDIVSYIIPRIGDVIMSGAKNTHLFHLPIQMVERYNPTPEFALIKRLFDVVSSSIVLIVLSPLLLIVAIAIKATDGGTVPYKQNRLTKDGKEFNVLKFRSMRMDAEKDGVARLSSGENDPRITPVGRFIRKYRIDELPQLINIIRGDMSVVGPRPERPEIAEEYEKEMPEFRLRLQVKAGLTGYAQVYGKYNSSPYDKLLMDLIYISKPGFAEDFKIIFATIKTLFSKESTEGIDVNAVTAMKSNRDEELDPKDIGK